MIQKQVEVYYEASNSVVVRLAERRFPGIVIQGDSLWALLQLAVEAQGQIHHSRSENPVSVQEIEATLAILRDRLAGYVEVYEKVLDENGIPLPYVRTAKPTTP